MNKILIPLTIALSAACGGDPCTTTGDITTPDQLSALSDCSVIRGSLAITAFDGITEIKFPNLTNLEQTAGFPPKLLIAAGSNVERVSFPRLRVTMGPLSISAPGATTVSLPALESASSVAFDGLKITALDLSALRTTQYSAGAPQNNVFQNLGIKTLDLSAITGDAKIKTRVVNNPQLESFSMGVSMGSFEIENNPALTTISLNNLQTPTDPYASSITVKGNAILSTLALPELVSGGTLVFEGNALAQLSMPKLTITNSLLVKDDAEILSISAPIFATIETLTVVNNTALKSIDMPLLTTIGLSASIRENSSLPDCVARTLDEQNTTFVVVSASRNLGDGCIK